MGGLLRYLYGPGKREEHVNPRVVAAWDGAGDMGALEPVISASGRRDFRQLIDKLEQPLRAARSAPQMTVWHCSIRNDASDRVLTDEQWRHIAAEMMAGVGLAPHGDTSAVRWLAVRHDDYGIHLVATLVRQDGRTAWGWQDKPMSRQVAYELEKRYGLQRVGPADKTSPRQPTSAETSKARRLGRTLTTREDLRRRVRAVCAASMSESEFFARLRDDGVELKFRQSTLNPTEVTGYSVALASDRAGDGQPIWFSGGKLAADLSLPKLRLRWGGDTASPDQAAVRVSPEKRARVLGDAARTAVEASDEMRRLAVDDPQAVQALAQAAADTLAALVSVTEGRKGGPLTRAAELFDKAARDAHAKVAKPSARSYEMRSLSRLIHLMGRASGDDDTVALLALVQGLARLGESLAWWREAQDRWHQVKAAQQAATSLRAWHSTGVRPGHAVLARPDPRSEEQRQGHGPVGQPASTVAGRRKRKRKQA